MVYTDTEAFLAEAKPGDMAWVGCMPDRCAPVRVGYQFDYNGLHIKVFDEFVVHVCVIRVGKLPENAERLDGRFQWDGNMTHPTIAPMIEFKAGPCASPDCPNEHPGWSGWVDKGRLVHARAQ